MRKHAEKAAKLASATEAAKAPGASEREISDCKMIEQEYMGLHKRTKAMIDDRGSDADKKKLARLELPTCIRTGLRPPSPRSLPDRALPRAS
jgi:hypothetical protein